VLSEARRDVRARHVPGTELPGAPGGHCRYAGANAGQARLPRVPEGLPGIRACITGASFFRSGWGSDIGCLRYSGRLISGGIGWMTLIKQGVSAG
jgi:hypothetical protein